MGGGFLLVWYVLLACNYLRCLFHSIEAHSTSPRLSVLFHSDASSTYLGT
jgi:hypothetical protein